MAQVMQLADELGSLALFADLSRPQLEAVAHSFEEVWFADGDRILREGLSGTGFYVLGRGVFFGEVSALLGEPPSADVVALRSMRCLYLPGPSLHEFLIAHPAVTYRMLLDQTRRLRTTTRARG